MKKLTLNKETLRVLSTHTLGTIQGGTDGGTAFCDPGTVVVSNCCPDSIHCGPSVPSDPPPTLPTITRVGTITRG